MFASLCSIWRAGIWNLSSPSHCFMLQIIMGKRNILISCNSRKKNTWSDGSDFYFLMGLYMHFYLNHPWYDKPNPISGQIETQGLYSLSGKTSYRKISWSLEAARFGFKLFQSLWILAGTSAALLPRCLSNFRAIRPLQHPISRLRDFTRFVGKTSYRLVNRGPEATWFNSWGPLHPAASSPDPNIVIQ